MQSRAPSLSIGLLARLCIASLFLSLPAASVQGQAAPQPQFRYWNTSWSFEEIDLRDLAGKLASIGVELPIELIGTASVNFDVSIPLNGLKDPKAYKFRGSISSPEMKADELLLKEFAANVNYSAGIVRLTDLRGKQENGSFAGTATADVASKGPFEVSLKVEQLELGPIAVLLAKLGVGRDDKLATGSLDGEISLTGTLSKVQDVTSWGATGNLVLRDVTVGDSIPYSLTINDLVLRSGQLVVPDLGVRSSALPAFYLRAGADIQLAATQKFAVSLQADDIPATDMMGLYFDSAEQLLDGKLDLEGKVTGELSPQDGGAPRMDIALALASPSIRALGVDLGLLEHRLTMTSDAIHLEPLRTPSTTQPLTIETLHADYVIEPERFRVMNLAARLFGGGISGDAELSRLASENHRLDLTWKQLEPNLQAPLGLGTDPLHFSAATTGHVIWSVPADKVDFPAFHSAELELNAAPMKLAGDPLGSVDVAVKLNESGFDLHGRGRLFGGRIEVTSNSPLDPTVRWSDVPKLIAAGTLLLNDVSVGDAIRVLARSNPRKFSGRISGTTEMGIDPEQGLESRSRWIVRDFGVDGHSLSRRLDADVSTRGTQVKLGSIRGNYAGGQVQASGQWSLAGGSRTIEVRVVRAEGDRLLLPLNATAERWVSGRVSGRASIVGYGRGPFDDFRVSGSVRLTDGRSFDIPIGNAHAPFRVLVSRHPFSWQADFEHVRSQLAHGQLDGDLSFSSSAGSQRGFNMDSRWRLNHVEFEELLHTYVGTRTLGRGVVTGRFGLSGRKIRTPNDLKGEFRMTLGGTDVTAVPGLPATSSLLGVASLAGTQFNSGEAVGRISQGAVNLQQFVLLSDRLKVVTSGRVGLKNGRVDMRTVATTGSFLGQSTTLQGIAPRALTSVSPVLSLNRLVSDRTVVVDMVGTLRDPQVRLLPAETLQANLRGIAIRQLTGGLAIESLLLNKL